VERIDPGSEGVLAHWFSGAPLAFAVVDRELRVHRSNDAFRALAADSRVDMPGRRLDHVLPTLAPSLIRLLEAVLERGETRAGQDIASEAGAPKIRAAAFPLRAGDGAVDAAGLVLWDEPESAAAMERRDERITAAMAGTGTGFWEWDLVADDFSWTQSLADLHCVEADRSPRNLGEFLDLIHPEDRPALERSMRQAADGREDAGNEYRVLLSDGTERWIAGRGHLLRDDSGRPSSLVGLMADVTERRRREDALTFLAEAGEALAGSLEPLRTMEEIARLAVPRLADWCAVQLADDEQGGFRNIAVAHVDPDKVRWARALEERYPPDPDAQTGAPAVIRTGRSELYPVIDEELLIAGAKDAEHLEIMRELRMNSAMVVPMRARERTLGAITFIFAESGRHYSTHELELAEELGRRAGLALDHARLYDREHRTAETLQRALLPPTLPLIEGHQLASRYLPGQVGDHVGGDWYDAFVLPDGRIGIAIGDIGGRGISAAALMGQMRNALRAYALKAGDPGTVLADLRLLADTLSELIFATVMYIVYDPVSGEAVLSNAGHLPALMLDAEHHASFLDAPVCPPLGTGATAPTDEHRFTLRPGATLVLYTDGLVESRERSLEHGFARLVEIAGASAGDVERLADDIVADLPERRDDDIALLALRRSID
jgi:serine phosphatase RsbU (regulator of sigma subunit)